MNQDANGRDPFFTRANRLFRGPVHPAAAQLPVEGSLPALDGATGWLNSSPLSAEGLRGRVVLVQFWTYTCINWLRTLGYVRAWFERYRDQGLVVIGVHTPEFPFEQDVDNVGEAVKDMNVEYPVALDPNYEVWNAFANQYWPAVYIADADGQIRHHQFGEGEQLRDAFGMDLGRSRQERHRRQGCEICGVRSQAAEDVTPGDYLAPAPDRRRLARPAELTDPSLAKQPSGWLWLGWLDHVPPPSERFGCRV